MSQISSTIPSVPGTQIKATSTMSQSSSAMLPLPETSSPGNGDMEKKSGAGNSGGLTYGVECIVGIVVGISL